MKKQGNEGNLLAHTELSAGDVRGPPSQAPRNPWRSSTHREDDPLRLRHLHRAGPYGGRLFLRSTHGSIDLEIPLGNDQAILQAVAFGYK